MGTAIFDVCDTLYATNTTVDFLRFLGGRGHPRAARAVDRWTRPNRAHYWLGALSARLFGRDIARERLIACLGGLDRRQIEAEAEAYAATSLPHCRNAALFDRLRGHASAGDRVWLASSSLEPVVAAIARSVSADFIASRLAFDGDICLGALADDLTGRKSAVLADSLGDVTAPVTVYTDNRSDLDLVALADRAVIVIPHGRQVEYWAGTQHEYLAL